MRAGEITVGLAAALHPIGATERASLFLATWPSPAIERCIFIIVAASVRAGEITVGVIRVGALALSIEGIVSITVVLAPLAKFCIVLRAGLPLVRSVESLRNLLGLRPRLLLLDDAARVALAHRALGLGKPGRDDEPCAALLALRHALLRGVVLERLAARHRGARLKGGLLRLHDLVLEQRDQIHVLFLLRPRARVRVHLNGLRDVGVPMRRLRRVFEAHLEQVAVRGRRVRSVRVLVAVLVGERLHLPRHSEQRLHRALHLLALAQHAAHHQQFGRRPGLADARAPLRHVHEGGDVEADGRRRNFALRERRRDLLAHRCRLLRRREKILLRLGIDRTEHGPEHLFVLIGRRVDARLERFLDKLGDRLWHLPHRDCPAVQLHQADLPVRRDLPLR